MSAFSSAAATKRLEVPGVSASSGLFQSPAQRTLLLCLLLTVVVLVAYNPAIHNGFINCDDDVYITNNPQVRAGLTWATVKWAFTTSYQANWHPLTWLSHALDCELFGLNPAGHHYVSVLLHAANAVVLFLFLQSATGFRWRSLMVAALFALHPINVESVAWAAERKNVLSMLFFLLALWAYVWYTRKPALLRYAVVFFLFALGLLSKPQVIAFPFLLWLLDYWPLGRIGIPVAARPAAQDEKGSEWWKEKVVWEKVPLLLLSAGSAVVTMKVQKAGLAVRSLSQYGLLLRLETAVISYARYMGKAIWPAKLVAMYPHPHKLYPILQVGAAMVLLALVTAWVLRAREQRYLVVGWFWFLGSLVPMIGLVQAGGQAMADRYAYIPFLGLFPMSIWLVGDWAKAHQISTRWIAVPAVSCLLVLGTLTYRQVGYWHDSESLWLRTLALTRDNNIAHDELGSFLLRQGRAEEAAAHYRAALAIRPDDVHASIDLGPYEQRRGNLSAAIELYWTVANHGLSADARSVAYHNLGVVYRQMGESIKAKQCFEKALQLEPEQPMTITELGLIAQENGDLPEAIRQYSRALAVQPTDAGYLLLAQALRQEGRLDEANATSEHVARFSPNLAEAQKTAAALLSGK
jgi:tetratricopeptide (TPR) repeat protein